PRIREYAAALDPEIVEIVDEVRELAETWRTLVESGDTGFGAEPPAAGVILREQAAFTATFEAANQADLAIRGETLARAQEIQGVERMTRIIYSLLVVIALAAALAVALLSLRIRRLAAEANSRRAEVEWALQETARAVEARAYLIRGFTHDVKNPLGAADGYASLLELGVRGKLADDQAETVRRIRRSISGAIEIIDELLDLSRLESGGLRTARVETDVNALVAESVRQHAVAAEAAGLDLSFEPLGHAAPGVVFTDPDRVAQIVGNLISNAVKYTPAAGRVRVSVLDREDPDAPHPGRWITIAVQDTGPGIAPEEIDRIFTEFHRVPGSPGEGHGLGLAISRGVARLLGGEVTVRSVVGEGSEFLLWLPVRE
ncbi:MAG: HAMP domain-containing sensor histidine kinase, partial [Gemmatimonadota bacterium]